MKKLKVKNQMKLNPWTTALAALGVVSLAAAARADEKMSQVQTALSNTTISGYVDTAATWRPGTDTTPAGGLNIPGYSFAKNDGFSLNAVDIALDRPMDESPWAAGYHIELMMGPDAVGYTTGLGASAGIRQAYLALRTPVANSGIDWKIGVWDTIIGYESSSDPLNPNYTRSYGYSIEPTTHLGILGTYKVNDQITVSAGVADDSNAGAGVVGVNSFHSESQKAYMGSVALTAPDSFGPMKGATLTLGAIDSAGHVATAAGSTSLYAGLTLPTPISALKFGAAFDYLDLHNGVSGAGSTNPGNDSVWVVGAYGSYQANDKLSFNLRGEYLKDDGAGPYGSAAEEFTATAQYNLWANVISRLEFRWDHVEHGTPFGANAAGLPFRANDFLIAANLIYQF
ncbi:MAG TPA: outer membrane beta-barrel protein [Verrucomicrobiae bacterium]|nr:outer membrane beta-barrel protein [Verrucomicrobiae bacterium]